MNELPFYLWLCLSNCHRSLVWVTQGGQDRGPERFMRPRFCSASGPAFGGRAAKGLLLGGMQARERATASFLLAFGLPIKCLREGKILGLVCNSIFTTSSLESSPYGEFISQRPWLFHLNCRWVREAGKTPGAAGPWHGRLQVTV